MPRMRISQILCAVQLPVLLRRSRNAAIGTSGLTPALRSIYELSNTVEIVPCKQNIVCALAYVSGKVEI